MFNYFQHSTAAEERALDPGALLESSSREQLVAMLQKQRQVALRYKTRFTEVS